MNPRDSYVSGHPILVPMIDLVTIGAGGGSIAHIDSAGGFHVGPAPPAPIPDPPATARRREPTVTDAQVALGRLDADKLLGGDLPIDPSLAERAIEEKIAKPLRLSRREAALGIIRVINSNMALPSAPTPSPGASTPASSRWCPSGRRSAARGRARRSGVGAGRHRPVAPGITAAMGLLETDMQYEHARSLIMSLTRADTGGARRIDALSAELVAECRAHLENDGVPPERQRYQRIAECRYHGQGFELPAGDPRGARSARRRCARLSRASTPSTAWTTGMPSTTARSSSHRPGHRHRGGDPARGGEARSGERTRD